MTSPLQASEPVPAVQALAPASPAAPVPWGGLSVQDLVPPEDYPRYRQILAHAHAATGARWVHLTLYDAPVATVRSVIGSDLAGGPLMRGFQAIQAMCPGFDPFKVACRVDVNPRLRAVYLEGRAVVARLDEIAEGIVHPKLVELAGTLAQMRYALSLPIFLNGSVVGGLTFHFRTPPDPTHRSVCEAFAHQASLTLSNALLSRLLDREVAELQRSRQLLVAADERLRRQMAETLHGPVQSRLLMVNHELEAIRRQLGPDDRELAERITRIETMLDVVREQDIRAVSHALHPAIVCAGLVPAVRSLLASFTGHFEVDLTVDERLVPGHPTGPWIPEATCLAVYRAVAEALNNASRHGHARRITMTLAMESTGHLHVVVADDGAGFDPAAVVAGLGLATVAAHVDQVGGAYCLTGAPGRGATLELFIPVPQAG